MELTHPTDASSAETHGASAARAGWLYRVFSTDHKTIGIQFLFFGLLFFIIGGLLAMMIRWQLAFPNDPAHPLPLLDKIAALKNGQFLTSQGNMTADFYNAVLTLHATLMVFFVVIPLLVGAFGNYLIPLKIGARDMAFPFLNGLAFWSAVPAGAIMVAGSFLPAGGAAAGWTSYPPLSSLAQSHEAWPLFPTVLVMLGWFGFFLYIGVHYIRTGSRAVDVIATLAICGAGAYSAGILVPRVAFDGQGCWFLSLFIMGFSSILGAVNYMTTILMLRCPGMFMLRLPLSVWGLFITAFIVLLATPVLAADLLMNLLDHNGITSFFLPSSWMVSGVAQNNAGQGDPLLHLHLFWFYSHPAVYIMILPAMGMVSDIISNFSRKPIFGYRPMVYASSIIAFLGFIVWGHHMFQSGMNPTLGTTFAFSTMLIAVPSAIKTFNWLGTLWGGNIHFTVPMCHALAFVSMFVIGGLSGIFLASTPVDVHVHMTYFVVAHIHYVLFGGSMFGIFSAITFWYPKMFGRMMNRALGYVHFILSFICFNGTFLLMHLVGLAGMPRRVSDPYVYSTFKNLQGMNQVMTWFALGLGAAQIIFAVNFLASMICGKRAQPNPWKSNTLEWTNAPSPPPHGNFAQIPRVFRGPYEYSSPEVAEDWLPQSRDLTEQSGISTA